MSDLIWVAIINGTFALVIVIANIALARKVEVVHKEMNSMKDALVAVTRSDALQEGHSSGVADAKAGIV